MGALLINLQRNGKTLKGATQLLKRAILEAAWLIWVMRDKRVIALNNDPLKSFSTSECANRWKSALSHAFELNVALAKIGKPSKAHKKRVLRTWSNTLKNEQELPQDWTYQRGVLVGMKVELNFPSL